MKRHWHLNCLPLATECGMVSRALESDRRPRQSERTTLPETPRNGARIRASIFEKKVSGERCSRLNLFSERHV